MTLFVFFSGCILRLPIWGDAADDNCFDDEPYWEVRDDSLQLRRRFYTLKQERQYQITVQSVVHPTAWRPGISKNPSALMILLVLVIFDIWISVKMQITKVSSESQPGLMLDFGLLAAKTAALVQVRWLEVFKFIWSSLNWNQDQVQLCCIVSDTQSIVCVYRYENRPCLLSCFCSETFHGLVFLTPRLCFHSLCMLVNELPSLCRLYLQRNSS